MGLIYVNPEGVGRQARSAEDRPGHARNLRPHGHERRGNRRPDGRRPHRRQGPRQRQRRQPGPGAGRCRCAGTGSGLDEPQHPRRGPRHRDQRHRGRLDQPPDPVGQRLLRHAVQARLVAAEVAGRRLAVGAGQHQGRGHAGRRGGSEHPLQADHDRRRHGAEVRPRATARLPSASTRIRPISRKSSPAPGSS